MAGLSHKPTNIKKSQTSICTLLYSVRMILQTSTGGYWNHTDMALESFFLNYSVKYQSVLTHGVPVYIIYIYI